MNEPNWLSAWTQEELQHIQREDKSINFILEHKLNNEAIPVLPNEVKTDKVITALWYQWNQLDVKNNLLHRKWCDAHGNTLYQLVASE